MIPYPKYKSESTFLLATLMINFYVYQLSFSTITTILSQFFSIPFYIYSWLIGTFIIGNLIYFFGRIKEVKWNLNVLLLLMIAVFCALISIPLYQPDSDDYFYLPNVVHYLNSPDELMNFKIHFIESEKIINSINWGTSISFEYYQGAISYILGIDFLNMYYKYHLAWVTFVFPFVFYIIIRQFLKSSIATILSVVILIGAVFLMSEIHRCPGRFFISRAFQGKSSMLFIFIPYFCFQAINYLQTKRNKFFVGMILTSIGAMGASTSSILLIPPLMISIYAASIFSSNHNFEWKIGVKYFFTFITPFIYACFIIFFEKHDLGYNSPINEGWPRNFLGHFYFLFSESTFNVSYWVPTFWLPLLGLIIILIIGEKRDKIFFLTWILTLIVCFANPIIASFWIKYVFGPNIFWRLYYMLPFLFLIGVSYGLIYEKINKTIVKYIFSIFTILFIVLLNMNTDKFGRFENTSVFEKGSTKIFQLREYNRELENEIIELNQYLVNGSMLASQEISKIVILHNGSIKAINHNPKALELWLGMEEAILRNTVMKQLNDNKSKTITSFKKLVYQLKPENIVIKKSKNYNLYCSSLKKIGYVEKYNSKLVILLTR